MLKWKNLTQKVNSLDKEMYELWKPFSIFQPVSIFLYNFLFRKEKMKPPVFNTVS